MVLVALVCLGSTRFSTHFSKVLSLLEAEVGWLVASPAEALVAGLMGTGLRSPLVAEALLWYTHYFGTRTVVEW